MGKKDIKKTTVPGTTNNKKHIWFFIGILSFITLFIYWKAINFDFLVTWDDNLYVPQNPDVKKLSIDNIKLLFSKFYVGNYQPLVMLIYAVEFQLSGMNAGLYHFSNILFHILNSILVFVLIKRIVPKNLITAFITAAFFAVHPMHVESVVWVAESKDVFYTFFFLLSLIYYTYYQENQKVKYLLYTGVSFILACLCKSASVVLPLILFLLDYYNKKREFKWKVVFEKIPFLVISLVFGIIAVFSQKTTIDAYSHNFTFIQRIFLISGSLFSYIYKALLPHNLSAIHPYPSECAPIPMINYISVVFNLAILVLVFYSRKYGKNVIFGFAFFLITIVLVLQIVPVGNAVMAERYTYVPYIGVFFIIGQGVDYLIKAGNRSLKKKGVYSVVVLSMLFILFSFYTNKRISIWRTDEALFTDVIDKYPDNYIAYLNRGSYYLNYLAEFKYSNNQSKRFEYTNLAQKDFEKAVKYSYNLSGLSKSYYNLGTAKAALDKHAEALEDYNKVVEINPDYPAVYVNRGNTKAALNDFKGALEDFNIAIAKMPDSPVAYNDRARLKGLSGDFRGAINDLNEAIKIDDKFVEAYNNRGNAKSALGDKAGAISDYNIAIKLDPAFDRLYVHRGIVKAESGDVQGALMDFNKALQLNPDNEMAYSYKTNLGNGLNVNNAVK